MATTHRFPDRITSIGWVLAFLGLVQAVYFLFAEYSAENFAGKMQGQLPTAKALLWLHLAVAVALVVAGLGLVARQNWAWWVSGSLIVLAAISSGLELLTDASAALDKATDFPESAVAIGGLAAWVVLLVVLLRAHPVLVVQTASTEVVVDEHTLAVVEATRKMSSRKSEDWSAESDDEDLVESLLWMAQARGGRDYRTGTPQDVKASQDEMERRMEELPAVIGASSLAIAVANVKGKVTLWNPAAQQLFGWSDQEMLGQPLPLGNPAGDTKPAALLERAMKEGSVIGIESEHPRKSGSPIATSMSISVLPDTSGSPGGFVLAITDTTERQDSLMQQMRARRTKARETTQAKIDAAVGPASEWVDTIYAGHARRVARMVELMATELGFSPDGATQIGRAALLHDIGKVGVSDAIWSKKGRLTDQEFEVVKTHTQVGTEMLSSTQSPLLKMAAEIAYTHHERWDGFGYLGMKGEDIPIGGRMVAVADAFDALTHDRPYRKARTIGQAMEEIQKESGNQFDPEVVGAFIRTREAGHIDNIDPE